MCVCVCAPNSHVLSISFADIWSVSVGVGVQRTHGMMHTQTDTTKNQAGTTTTTGATTDGLPPLCAEHDFKLSRAMIVTKLSRLELEQHRRPDLNAVQLEKFIRDRGTDYDSLLYHHHIHKNFQARVADCFSEAGIAVRVSNRYAFVFWE